MSTSTQTRTNEHFTVVGNIVRIRNRQSCKRFDCPIRPEAHRQNDWFADRVKYQADVLNAATRYARFTGINDAGVKIAINWSFVQSVGCYRRQLFVNGKLAKVRFYQSK